MMKYLLPILICLLFSACTHENASYPQSGVLMDGMDMKDASTASTTEEALTNEPPPPPPPPEQPQEPAPDPVDKAQKIIKDGNVSLEVNDLKAAKTHIDTILQTYKAYYEHEAYESSSYQSVYNLKIRVPADHFEALLKGIEQGGGKIRHKTINARDVTEQFMDLSTRLANKRAYLKRYNELLKKANSIKDILEIQERMRVIEVEIESAEGRLRYLSDKVQYSSLNLRVFEKHETHINEERNFGKQLSRAFQSGVDGFLNFIILTVHMWPFLLLLVIAIWLIGRWRRKQRRAKGA